MTIKRRNNIKLIFRLKKLNWYIKMKYSYLNIFFVVNILTSNIALEIHIIILYSIEYI